MNKSNVAIISGLCIAFFFAFLNIHAQNPCPKWEPKGNPKITQVQHPDWAKNANIYEVNLRQYTKSGTLKDFSLQVPRLKKMGVDILWFMPIHPIGVKNRKGTLGSYYSVRDYTAIDTAYGTLAEFRALVGKAHQQGMHVILDWVANHTAWDNKWVTEHPDWYKKDSTGKIASPFDWTDVAALDYRNGELRKSMIDAMKFWIREADIDGFRCDVAGMVPLDFWVEVRKELDKLKPVFMLAEAEEPPIHKAFDMTYGWELHHLMNQIAKGEKKAADLWAYFSKNDTAYPRDAYRMYFTSNHDENSWNGTEFERMKGGAKAFAVLCATVPGMPLIYSGQEAAMDKRLSFFEKDSIPWGNYSLNGFYSRLNRIKSGNQVFWNGESGGSFIPVFAANNDNIFAFVREKDGHKALVVLNLSGALQQVTLQGDCCTGKYKGLLSKKPVEVKKGQPVELRPWEYVILYQ